MILLRIYSWTSQEINPYRFWSTIQRIIWMLPTETIWTLRNWSKIDNHWLDLMKMKVAVIHANHHKKVHRFHPVNQCQSRVQNWVKNYYRIWLKNNMMKMQKMKTGNDTNGKMNNIGICLQMFAEWLTFSNSSEKTLSFTINWNCWMTK